jgi:adhesin transport system outer membrane protein
MKKSLLLALSIIVSLNAQDLKLTVDEVLSTNPIVLERLKNYNATKEDITSAKSGYYPKLDLSLGVGVENT